ncbi:MAG: KEOPS complex subunit Cgi121 [Promethearchaeati archaeon SRVP18_Atabeyarchaeia-1]
MKLIPIAQEGEETPEYHIAIGGFRDCPMDVRMEGLLESVKAIENSQTILAVQLFDAERVTTHLHLLVSAIYALHAFRNSRNISNTLGTETLLYSSAQRQITEAIEKMGVNAESTNLAALVISLKADATIGAFTRISNAIGGALDDTVLNINEPRKLQTIRRTFKIGDEELESAIIGISWPDVESAITKRVLSRISMMAISK